MVGRVILGLIVSSPPRLPVTAGLVRDAGDANVDVKADKELLEMSFSHSLPYYASAELLSSLLDGTFNVSNILWQ